MGHAPRVVVNAGCALGEGALWDEREQRVYWVDIVDPSIHSLDPASGQHQRWPMPERIGFIVRRADGRGFVAGFKSGLASVENADGALRVTPLAGYVPGGPDDRINDGCVDLQGRLWFGTMDDRHLEATGYLHVYDGTGTPRREDGPYKVTNGPCLSPDGRILYHTDTDNGAR